MGRILVSFLLFLLPLQLLGQVAPAEGALLNYRIIPFQQATGQKPHDKLEIAKGYFTNADSFKHNVIITVPVSAGKQMAEVPLWGTHYTWRRINNGEPGVLHHFSTLQLPFTDSSAYRLKVLQPTAKFTDALVFCDATRALYTMQGRVVWVLPDIEGIVAANTVIRDLKLSPAGTITFMTMTMAYEIDYNGKILWRAPNTGEVSGEKIEHYHHEFTRLTNGHYMTLGHEMRICEWQQNTINDSTLVFTDMTLSPAATPSARKSFSMPFGTVLEYNKEGQLVWSWKYFSYFSTTQRSKNIKDIRQVDSHENAFYFDEKAGYVYVSYKNANQLLKIKYPKGDVIAVYDGAGAGTKDGLFCQQHACKKSANGNLYLFNNNFCNPDALPAVIKLKELPGQKNNIKKVWEYRCPADAGKFVKPNATMGGNVVELPGGELFVSLCSPYSNLFIVNSNKQKLWSADLEKWDAAKGKWMPQEQYRASIISDRKKLEQLVWNAATAR